MLKNLVQIINGCGGAETIEECAYLPMQLGAVVIVVDAIWPKYLYPNGDENYAKTMDLVPPDFQLEDLKSICDKHGWHYLKMDDYAYNGTQYNYALDYIEKYSIPCDHIFFIDSDETLDPMYKDVWLSHIQECKNNNLSQLRFSRTVEILPEWKIVTVDTRVGGNYSILWGNALKVRREEYFDGNYHFKSPVSFGVTQVPLYHLHHFRKNAYRRIENGIFQTGGVEYDIKKAPNIHDSDYIQHLKEKYKNKFQVNNQGGSYLGSIIFEQKARHAAD